MTTNDISILDGMRAQRSTSRFSTQPVPDDVIKSILRAAGWAPSGGNRQPWRFVVVRDPALKRQIGVLYDQGGAEARGHPAPDADSEPSFSAAPLIILVCFDPALTHTEPDREVIRGASVYPAMQNLMLAAVAYGLGSRPTTVHRHREAEIKALLGIPDNIEIAAVVPIGYPGEGEHFGGKKRKPVREIAFDNTWDRPLA